MFCRGGRIELRCSRGETLQRKGEKERKMKKEKTASIRDASLALNMGKRKPKKYNLKQLKK